MPRFLSTADASRLKAVATAAEKREAARMARVSTSYVHRILLRERAIDSPKATAVVRHLRATCKGRRRTTTTTTPEDHG